VHCGYCGRVSVTESIHRAPTHRRPAHARRSNPNPPQGARSLAAARASHRRRSNSSWPSRVSWAMSSAVCSPCTRTRSRGDCASIVQKEEVLGYTLQLPVSSVSQPLPLNEQVSFSTWNQRQPSAHAVLQLLRLKEGPGLYILYMYCICMYACIRSRTAWDGSSCSGTQSKEAPSSVLALTPRRCLRRVDPRVIALGVRSGGPALLGQAWGLARAHVPPGVARRVCANARRRVGRRVLTFAVRLWGSTHLGLGSDYLGRWTFILRISGQTQLPLLYAHPSIIL